ncbi:MAG TPA: Gmad2 immunoglobulin-like domain-containing protein [Coriobacteriia bacterium]|nr:Gmad2 immunoglobulin-like domain-containing protein [Coriobacteriia bacterium]
MCTVSALRRMAVLGLALVLAAALVACAPDSPGEPGDGAVEPTDTVEPTVTPPADGYREGVKVYFIRNEKLGASAHYRTSESEKSAQELAAIELLAGPDETERGYGFTTAIPEGTTLLDLTIGPDGINTIDLSGAFDDGGGTLSMSMRLAQVVFALTQFPDCTGVLFEIDGMPVSTFSGEGIILDGPQTRDDFEELLPAIFVESPVPGSRVPGTNSGVLLTYGTANVFEAVFQAEVRAADGSVLAKQRIMASSGTGTRGTFSAEIPFTVPAGAERGSLVVYVASPKDGAPIDVVTIPVDFGMTDS